MSGDAAPLVRAEADRLGVSLRNLAGTGAGGRVSLADVRRAAARNLQPVPLALARAAGGARPRPVLVATGNPWDKGRAPMVDLDLYDLNPLVTYVRNMGERSRTYYGDEPTMFAAGPLPPFTSSGLEPSLLMSVPWTVRHAAAATTDRADVFRMVEGLGDPEQFQTPEGAEALRAYKGRVWEWATRSAPEDTSVSDEDYRRFWGEQ